MLSVPPTRPRARGLFVVCTDRSYTHNHGSILLAFESLLPSNSSQEENADIGNVWPHEEVKAFQCAGDLTYS